jgi:hypothetical protein
MENFDWTQFKCKIPVEAPVHILYDAWTIPSEIERWFLSDASFFTSEGKPTEKSDRIQAGYTYKWQWFLWDGTEEGKVTKVNGKDHIQFTFAGDCLVDVYLEAYDKGTIISISQSNIPTDNKSKRDVRLGCFSGWSFYLVSIKSIYEGGLDLRNKDVTLKMMTNS